MENISLKNRVAVVTGAGRALGRAYALLLAEYGAKVVVNDLGTDGEGYGSSPAVAQQVVDEIRAKGGEAQADAADVASVDGGRSIVQQALDTWGRIDIVVNNAGICGSKPFAESTLADFEHYWRIHVGGHVNVTRAAWPYLQKQGYGRVIMTSSGAGLYGLHGQSTYSAAKGAIHGLMRTLAIEGAEHGIRVNGILPGGFSRMHEAAISDPAVLDMMRRAMPPELVAPAVVWLASESCDVSGEEFAVWSGRIARVGIGTGPGYVDSALTAEKISRHREMLDALANFYEPRNAIDEVTHWQTVAKK